MPNYFVIEEITAPKDVLEQDGNRLQRIFKKGELISGKPKGYAKYKGSLIHVIREFGGYMIPAKNLKQADRNYSSDGTEQAQEMSDKVEKIINRDILLDSLDLGRKSMKGMVIGTFGGFALALLKGKSLMWYGLIGGVSGGLIGTGISKLKKTKKEKDGNIN